MFNRRQSNPNWELVNENNIFVLNAILQLQRFTGWCQHILLKLIARCIRVNSIFDSRSYLMRSSIFIFEKSSWIYFFPFFHIWNQFSKTKPLGWTWYSISSKLTFTISVFAFRQNMWSDGHKKYMLRNNNKIVATCEWNLISVSVAVQSNQMLRRNIHYSCTEFDKRNILLSDSEPLLCGRW